MNFKEYYEYYLTLHTNPKCRLLHFIGQWVTIAFIILVFHNWYWFLIPVIPFVVYPFAWTGHLVFEGNRPAAWDFRRTLPSKVADIRMCTDMLVGNIPL